MRTMDGPAKRKDTPNVSESPYPKAPGNVITLLDLDEVRRLWGLSVYAIYKYADEHREGEDALHTYGRPGRQRYYSYAELRRAFGELDHKLFSTDRIVDSELLKRLNLSRFDRESLVA
jgi:hypothetical protein